MYCIYHIFYRVRRFLQFGLDKKWIEKAKIDHSDWKIAMKKSGNPVSRHFFSCCNIHVTKYSAQVPSVEVEFSDRPKIEKLTITHLLGPILLHCLIMALATFVWLGEMFFGYFQKRKNRVTELSQP